MSFASPRTPICSRRQDRCRVYADRHDGAWNEASYSIADVATSRARRCNDPNSHSRIFCASCRRSVATTRPALQRVWPLAATITSFRLEATEQDRTYTYLTTFAFTGYNPAAASINGQYRTDNWLSEIVLNGQVVNSLPNNETAPADQTNNQGDTVSLQISATDSLNNALTYSATGLPNGLSIDPNSGLITGVLAEDAAGPGFNAVTVTATDGNGQSVSQTFNWIVNAPPISAQGVSIGAVEGVDPGSITVATFTTPDLNSLADDFTATIDWGDGTTDTGVLSGGNGSFTVTDDHIYAEIGSYPVTITIADSLTGGTATVATTATVTDAPLTLTGGFQLGDPMSNPVSTFTLATFTDANVSASANDYSVTINWGDGSPLDTGAYIESMGNGMYEIVAPHSYSLTSNQVGPLTYTVDVTLTDVDGASASTTSTVVVGQLAAGVPAYMDNWGFADQNPNATPSDFVANGQSGVALINWGDGTTSLGTITGGGSGGGTSSVFDIQGTHTYTQDSYDQPNGQYQITVTVTDVDGSTLTGTQYVSVVRPQESLDVANLDIASSLTVSNAQVAAFTVPDATDGASEFTAQINWGDGNTSSGTIQEVAPGLFQVLGSHTYASYNWYTMTVTVSQGWGGQVADAKGEGENGGKPIIFFVRDNKRITTKLYVAKWENSFVRLANGTIQVRPDPISPDPARFGVEVIDEAANKNPNVKDTITVKVSTSLHGLAKNIVLEETENNSGIFTSYEGGNGSGWLMLVSVAKDAEYKNTFLVDLGDTIRATYDGQKATATVPVVKVVRLHINIMNNKQGGSPVTSITKVQGYVQWANRIYAQVGIRFDASIQIVEPPIDLSEGLDSYLGGFFRKGKIPMTDEEKSLLGVATLRTNSVNDIVVYYVNKLNLSNGNVGTQGEAFWAAAVPESKYADSVVIASNFSAYTVLAHEIGHVLLDDGNHPNGYAGTNIVNLMSGPTLIANGYTDSRRITAEQGKDMFNKRPNLLSNP